MKSTRLANMLLISFLLCLVLVIVYTTVTAESYDAVQGGAPSLWTPNQSNPEIAAGGEQPKLLADIGELRLWGVSWSTEGTNNGAPNHHPDPMNAVLSTQFPDLKLVKEADPLDGLLNNGTLTFTLTLSGPGLNVVLRDPLPANVNYVDGSVTEPASFDSQAKVISWQGTLPSDSLTVRFQVTPTLSGSTAHSLAEAILNTAWMTDTDNDRTIAASVVVNAHRIYLPLVQHNSGGIVPAWDIILEDDFEGPWPGPWQLEYNPGTNPYLWAKRDCRSYSGGNSAWVVGGNSGSPLSCGVKYPKNLFTYMMYGPFSLEDAAAADLTFQLWLNSMLGQDRMYWGAALNEEDFYGFFLSGNSSGWQEFSLDLRYLPTLGDVTGQSQVWIVLAFISDGFGGLPEGAYVDDVLLRKTSSTAQENTWQQFSFLEVGTPARGCAPVDPEGLWCSVAPNAKAAGAPPWIVTVPPEGALLKVTDGWFSGDVFDVYDAGTWIGRTLTANLSAECLDPDTCYRNPGMSSGEFPLVAGQHSITIVPSESRYGGGAAFFRVD